ncbi:MAG: MBOAT family protein [Candidatus Azobacteroides sp.]|nr:MBOAT family protein [Candidatus Azobacteroides sp.]
MLFNSLAFLAFFPVVCLLYWLLPPKYRNGFLLLSSYYFYMSWKPVYGLLILFSTLVTWLSGIYIGQQRERRRKKAALTLALASNFSLLFFFKYWGFFGESVNYLLDRWNLRIQFPFSSILLPIGISFYTFQTVAYVIDVYRKEIEPERNFLTYALFVSFFPQLVAGPIERAKNLLPQFRYSHSFDDGQFLEGIRTMAWGYFMKLCIADRVAPYVDAVFDNYRMHNGTSLLLGAFFFTFQIFCDFGGYSLIALGTAQCLRFRLTSNFERPYLSSNVQIFWRRWHRSLSSWFMDYVYIPLGGNRCNLPRHLLNLLLTFAISGLWHGANWTFLVWGILHGIFMMLSVLMHKLWPPAQSNASLRRAANIVFTFVLVLFSWIFFRASHIATAWIILKKIFTEQGALYKGQGLPELLLAFLCIGLLMFKEIKEEAGMNIHFIHSKNTIVSTISLSLLIAFILLFAEFSGNAFIYFQF